MIDIKSQSVLDTLNHHVSIRRYDPDAPVSDELLHALLNSARRSPTSSNLQAYSFVVVRDAERKARIAELAGNQQHIIDAPVFVACCADLHRLDKACQLHGQGFHRNLETTIIATVDASLVGMSLATLAESVGLGTVMIGGVRNNPAPIASLLGLPDGVFVVYGMCIGYPIASEIPAQKPRLPESLVIHQERYDVRDISADLQAHDAELAEHYRALGRNTPDEAWTGVIASKFSQPIRAHMKATLAQLGFSVE